MQSNKNHPDIEALIMGDTRLLKKLYEVLLPKFSSYVYKNSGTYEDAEEVFQDALYQLIVRAKVSGIKIEGSFEGYVFTVCRNLWFKELKKRKKRVRNDDVFELKDEDESHVIAILQQERWDLFEKMMKDLSEKCSDLLKAYFNNVSYKAIVKKFSYATENAAFQRVFKCKKQLMKLVKSNPKYKNLLEG